MEPEAVNNLVKEAERLREKIKEEAAGNFPQELEHLLDETSVFFQEEILANWRGAERFDELIDYILYEYAEVGGSELWQQVLLDLRLKNDEDRAHKLLDGLYHGRAERFWVALRNVKKHPKNHLGAATCLEAKGLVMAVLYEHAFLLENKPESKQNPERVALVRKRIWEVFGEQKID
jgi:hypothetical protein